MRFFTQSDHIDIREYFDFFLFKKMRVMCPNAISLNGNGCSRKDVQFADKLRYFRNGILYYGKVFDKDYAEKVVGFLKRIYPELRKKVDEQKGDES